jgi:hypothetical protein
MDQLGAAGGRPRREIIAFYQRNRQTAGECIDRNASAHTAATDDDKVKRF